MQIGVHVCGGSTTCDIIPVLVVSWWLCLVKRTQMFLSVSLGISTKKCLDLPQVNLTSFKAKKGVKQAERATKSH